MPKLLLQALSAYKVAVHHRCALVEVVCKGIGRLREKWWQRMQEYRASLGTVHGALLHARREATTAPVAVTARHTTASTVPA